MSNENKSVPISFYISGKGTDHETVLFDYVSKVLFGGVHDERLRIIKEVIGSYTKYSFKGASGWIALGWITVECDMHPIIIIAPDEYYSRWDEDEQAVIDGTSAEMTVLGGSNVD